MPIGYVNSNLSTLQDMSRNCSVQSTLTQALWPVWDNTATAAEVEEIRRRFNIDFLRCNLPQLRTESREANRSGVQIRVRDSKTFHAVMRGAVWCGARGYTFGARIHIQHCFERTEVQSTDSQDFPNLPLIECCAFGTQSSVSECSHERRSSDNRARDDPRVSTGSPGDNIWIAIGDDWRGYCGGCAPRIFDPFFTTKPVAQRTGAGSGNLVRQSSPQHHGNIEHYQRSREKAR